MTQPSMPKVYELSRFETRTVSRLSARPQAVTSSQPLPWLLAAISVLTLAWSRQNALEMVNEAQVDTTLAWAFADGVLDDLKETRHQLAEAKDDSEILSEALTHTEKTRDQLKISLLKLERTHESLAADASDKLFSLTSYSSQLKNTLSVETTQRSAVERKAESLLADKKILTAAHQEATQLSASLKLQANDWQAHALRLQQEGNSLSTEYHRLQACHRTLESANAQLQSANSQLQGEVSRLQSCHNSLESKVRALECELARLRSKVRD